MGTIQTAVLPEWEEEEGRIPIRDLPGWRSSLSVASLSDFGHLLLLYFKLSICPFYCENGCMTIHHLTRFSLSPPLLDLCSRCAAGISVVDNLQDDS